MFEGKKHEGVDLAGLRKLSTKDYFAAQVEVGRVQRVHMASMAFLNALASVAAGRPRSFFGGIAGADAFRVPRKVKAMIEDIEDEEAEQDGLRINFKRPGAFGKKLDLSRLREMTSDEFVQAEEMIGFDEWSGSDDVVSIKYACAVAAIALCPEKPDEQLSKLMEAPFWVGTFILDVVQSFFGQSGSEEEERKAEEPSETTS